jgi:hypothetical protein
MRLSFSLLFILFFNALYCQSVEQQKSTMSLGPQNGYYIEVEGASKNMLENLWKDYVKEFGNTKYNKKAKEFVTDKVKVTMINGVSPISLYAKHDEGKGLGTTYLWVDLGGSFASGGEHKSQSEGIETFLKDFYIVARKKVITKELEAEEKKLKDLNKDLTKLEDKKKDFHNEIEKCKMKILEAEKNIETNIKDQETKKTDIENQKTAIQLVIDKLNAVGKNM